jgi:hypothetical protein
MPSLCPIHDRSRGFCLLVTILLLHPGALTSAKIAAAGDFTRRVSQALAAPFAALHREKPLVTLDPCVADLARQVDWLERRLAGSGTITAKEPDVWGQNRLTRHRQEYESLLARQLPLFEEKSHAAIRRSDQQFLGMALALQAAAGRRRDPAAVTIPEAGGSASVINQIGELLPSTNEPLGRSGQTVIARTEPFGLPAGPAILRLPEEPISLEPTLHLDHLSRYVGHLQSLRRINEGDDSADAPGYSLNLVRLPVSVLPGADTARGHGAEICFIADLDLDLDLLPRTFRSLVINDLVDLLAPPLVHCVNDADCIAWADRIMADTAFETSRQAALPRQSLLAAIDGLATRLPAIAPATAPAAKTRRSRLPLPASQLAEVSGVGPMAMLIHDAYRMLASHPASRPCIEYAEVRSFLQAELEAACDFLALPALRPVWDELGGWNLAALVRGRQTAAIDSLRCHVLTTLGGDALAAIAQPAGDQLILPADDNRCCTPPPPTRPLCRTTTAALAWGILVESALLNDRLQADVFSTHGSDGEAPDPCIDGPFWGPDPAPAARHAFAGYVRRRWPVRVFALDPVTDEQNIEDAFASRRESQIAVAMAVASGRINAQSLNRYSRRLEADMATVAVNRTSVGFVHGADTFGWRFYPRVQTPATKTGIAGFADAICGPDDPAALATRRLEPGMRECVALIVMPSFVRGLSFDVRSGWFSLTHPRHIEQGMRRALELAQAVKAIQQQAAACCGCREGLDAADLAHLLRRVDQLDRALPLQTLAARIPLENTAGGFELFDAGITDIAPELAGWYGPPGIDPDGATSLFLVGDGFSVHDTRLLAGGTPVPFSLVSRELIEARIPPGVATLAVEREDGFASSPAGLGCERVSHAEPLPAPSGARQLDDAEPSAYCRPNCNRRELVALHLATPSGLSNQLFVPVVRHSPATAAASLAILDSPNIGLTFTTTKASSTTVPTVKLDEFFTASRSEIAIRTPPTFIPPSKALLQITLHDAATGALAATLSTSELFFDAPRGGYLIAGAGLRNLVGDTTRPATDRTLRGAVKPYLDSRLLAGSLAEDGDAVTLTARCHLTAEQQSLPVAGEITITTTRRGRTVLEPTTEAP